MAEYYSTDFNEILEEERQKLEETKTARKSAVVSMYDGRISELNEQYDKAIDDTNADYSWLKDRNTVQRLITERQIKETLTKMNVKDSELNRTQRTATQISHTNRNSDIDRARRNVVDRLSMDLATSVSWVEQNKDDTLTELEAFSEQEVQNNAIIHYNANLQENKRIYEEELRQYEEGIKAAAADIEKSKYIVSSSTGTLNRAYVGSLKENGVDTVYNYQADGTLKSVTYTDNNSGISATFAAGVNPYCGYMHGDAKDKNGVYDASKVFSNGYQPNNIGGKKLVLEEKKGFSINGNTQNVFKCGDKYYVWDGAYNEYFEVERLVDAGGTYWVPTSTEKKRNFVSNVTSVETARLQLKQKIAKDKKMESVMVAPNASYTGSHKPALLYGNPIALGSGYLDDFAKLNGFYNYKEEQEYKKNNPELYEAMGGVKYIPPNEIGASKEAVILSNAAVNEVVKRFSNTDISEIQSIIDTINSGERQYSDTIKKYNDTVSAYVNDYITLIDIGLFDFLTEAEKQDCVENLRTFKREIEDINTLCNEVYDYYSYDELKKKESEATDNTERLYYLSLANLKYYEKVAIELARVKMDGEDISIFQAMTELAKMKDGKEKKARKKIIEKQVEKAGYNFDEIYSPLTGDENVSGKYFAKYIGNKAGKGLSVFSDGFYATADILFGKPLQALGWENNPISWLREKSKDNVENFQFDDAYYTDKTGNSAALQNIGTFVENVAGALPYGLLAYFTGGASAAGSAGLSQTAAAATGGAAAKASITLQNMMKNPQFWTTFASTYGHDYESAIDMGVSEEIAVLGATIISMVNAGIEIGLDGQSGIQGLTQQIRNGDTKAFYEWLKSGGQEALEEMLQGTVSRGTEKALYNSDVKVLDGEAMLEEGAMGGAVGLFLGGGPMAVNYISGKTSNSYNANITYGSSVESINALVENGLAMPEDSNVYKQATKAKSTLDSGKSLSGTRLYNLATAIEGEIQTKSEARLSELGENKGNIKEVSAAVAKKVFSGRLTSAEAALISNSKYGNQVVEELSADSANTIWKDTIKGTNGNNLNSITGVNGIQGVGANADGGVANQYSDGVDTVKDLNYNDTRGGENGSENSELLARGAVSAVNRSGNGLRQQGENSAKLTGYLGTPEAVLESSVTPYRAGESGRLVQRKIKLRSDKAGQTGFEESVLRAVSGIELSGEDTIGRTISGEIKEKFKNTVFKDEKGNLLSLYHWTSETFSEFEKGEFGFHFGTLEAAHDRNVQYDEEYIGDYKGNYKEVYLNISNPIEMSDEAGEWSASWVAFQLVESGIITEQQYSSLATIKGFYDNTYDNPAAESVRRILKDNGYDGIVYKNNSEDVGSYSAIALYPDQILTVAENGVLKENIGVSEAVLPSECVSDAEADSGLVEIVDGGMRKSEPVSKYVNSSDQLYKYASKIRPLPNYEDMVIHGDAFGFQVKDKDGKPIEDYSAVEFAKILREDPNYHGGDIRLIACESGAEDMGAAQILANQLKVNVLAPSDIVWVTPQGKIIIGPTEFENTGYWKLFKPKGI